MGRLYTAQFNGVAVSAQQDFFEINVPSTSIVLVHRIVLGQTSDVGDAEEEGLLIRERQGNTTSGSGGSTPTAVPLILGDSAFAGTVEANNTTKATSGTAVTKRSWAWNVRMPFEYVMAPEERTLIRPSTRWCLELATTPGDALTMHGFVLFESLG